MLAPSAPLLREIGKPFSAAWRDAGGERSGYRGLWHAHARDNVVVLTAWVPSEYTSTAKPDHVCPVKPDFAHHLQVGQSTRIVMVKRTGTDPQRHAIPGVAAALPGIFVVTAICEPVDGRYVPVEVARAG